MPDRDVPPATRPSAPTPGQEQRQFPPVRMPSTAAVPSLDGVAEASAADWPKVGNKGTQKSAPVTDD